MSKPLSTLDKLSQKEREALAAIYDVDGFKALKKLCDYEIVELGQDALQAPTMELKEVLRGKALMAFHIPEIIKKEAIRQRA